MSVACRTLTRLGSSTPSERKFCLKSLADLKTVLLILEAEISSFVCTSSVPGETLNTYLVRRWGMSSWVSSTLSLSHSSGEDTVVAFGPSEGEAAERAYKSLANLPPRVPRVLSDAAETTARVCKIVSAYYLKVGRGELPLLDNPGLLDSLVRASSRGENLVTAQSDVSRSDWAVLTALGFGAV